MPRDLDDAAHPRHPADRGDQPAVRRWLQAGAVAAGLGAAMIVTPVAAVATADDSAPAASSSDDAATDPVDNTADTAEPSSTSTATPHRDIGEVPRSTLSAQGVVRTQPSGDDDETDDAAAAADETIPTASTDVVEPEPDAEPQVDSPDPVIPAAPSHAPNSGSDAPSAPAPKTPTHRSVAPAATTQPEDTPKDGAAAPETSGAAIQTVARVAAPLALVSVTTKSYPAAVTAPVSIRAIVADVLRWTGFGALDPGVPLPSSPLNDLLAGAWVAVRRLHYTLFNAAPTLSPAQISQDARTGVVEGTLGGADADGDQLTYALVGKGTNGVVVLGSDGTYTYTPSSAFAHEGGTDSFTVSVTDAIANPWHIHGLADLFGHAAPATQMVIVTVAPVNTAPTAPPTITAPAPGADGVVTGSIGASDPDGDTVTYSIYRDPNVVILRPKGTATIDTATGVYEYTPAAWARHDAAAVGTAPITDTFVVTTTDSYGAQVRTTVVVSIKPDNKLPTVDPAVTLDPAHASERIVISYTSDATGTSTTTVSTSILLITPNVGDADGDSVTVTAVNADQALGTVTRKADGTFGYTPTLAALRAGGTAAQITDIVALTLDDGHGGVTSAKVTVTLQTALIIAGTLATSFPIDAAIGTADTSGLTNPGDQLTIVGVAGLIERVGDDLVFKPTTTADLPKYALGPATDFATVTVVQSGDKVYVYKRDPGTAQSSLFTIFDLGPVDQPIGSA
ncbi:hypothetical protein TUM20985_11360 [Mycobacterium antarcticum]|uniref:Ig-like domain-containing protein n=1 Tax=unclassified Mycolicibacterium TaxID=2636767 RepID=UPI0023A16638|nr:MULTISPECIES: Ig-like domain-containing protein [unclassified Mycolicibacterium]BDX30589.1 hypothetical protein TUM20985_11360 [Mycolicibacterium sp. TUM20985]GLP78571.1 hypothetical protein TUM20983_56810 [Mycolicibacterium sp. TUM20983]GLP79713.1 hypothetical protein TUM20984_11330 [Mycolicibacterium sp. TUM20984]